MGHPGGTYVIKIRIPVFIMTFVALDFSSEKIQFSILHEMDMLAILVN